MIVYFIFFSLYSDKKCVEVRCESVSKEVDHWQGQEKAWHMSLGIRGSAMVSK
jgi:hypothetical protein